MKIVLYNKEKIVEEIEGVHGVEVIDEHNIRWEDGQLSGIKVNFAIIEDDEEFILEDRTNDLSLIKEIKRKKISEDCRKSILFGFTSNTTGHYYEFQETDQINFSSRLEYLKRNEDTQTILWKVNGDDHAEHTREEFIEVCNEGEQHKQVLLEKYWNIRSKILNATSREEIESIEWEGDMISIF